VYDIMNEPILINNSHKMLKDIFEKGLITSKVGFVLVLLILSFVNADGRYVGKNPRMFMTNNMIIAGTAALSTLYVALNRNSGDVFNKVFMVFLFIFFFQVCREMSGYYGFTGDEEKTENEKAQISSKPALITVGLIAVLGSIFFLYLAIKIRHGPPMSMGSFALETAIFASILTVGEVYVGYSHGQVTALPLVRTSCVSFIMFVILAVVFQYGGFYEHVFKVKNI